MKEFNEMHAELCKTISNAARLEILHTLRNKELNASQLTEATGLSKANLSQHMSLLVQQGVVLSRKEGVHVFYKIADQRILKAIDLIREILVSRYEAKANIIKNYR